MLAGDYNGGAERTEVSMPDVEKYAVDLQPLVHEAQRETAKALEEFEEAKVKLSEARANENRVIKARDLLFGETYTRGGRPLGTRGRPPKRTMGVRNSNAWRPSREKLDAIQKAVEEGAQTVSQIVKATEITENTVRAGLNALRVDQRIRLAGQEPNHKALIWKPMAQTNGQLEREAVNAGQ